MKFDKGQSASQFLCELTLQYTWRLERITLWGTEDRGSRSQELMGKNQILKKTGAMQAHPTEVLNLLPCFGETNGKFL
uniref:AlNc14C244G9523 protein n=1 Tax=Albugo laibachii Nc14 TaxID=890382 RepID=F0WT36_9STRA|nr:AlNc14C244G9523 [Albugo laibachii Nc14]|eukprot:CCA24523.1 AlNc14C244G9523 [Albugo laibachii Nc14]